MKFNPVSQRLYTDDGQLIKQLECRFPVRWDEMQQTGIPGVRRCDICEDGVIDSAGFSDEKIVQMVEQNNKLCLRVSLSQANLKITPLDSEP
jgi:hypothetical protein